MDFARDQRAIATIAALTALLIGASPAAVFADEEIPFDQAELFFELNNTDKDLGIHTAVDGGPWKRLKIEDPNEKTVLHIRTRGRLREQGLTQLFIESAEPVFEELPPEEFFERFPEGVYEIEGRSIDNEELENEVEISHVMPAPAGNVTVDGMAAAENCDAVLPVVMEPVVIAWDPVTTSHPTVGKDGPIEVDQYQFFVERDGVKLSLELPPEVTEFTVPSEVLALGDEFKFEILVRATNGNNTAIESCFVVAP